MRGEKRVWELVVFGSGFCSVGHKTLAICKICHVVQMYDSRRRGYGERRTHASGRWLGSLPQGSPKGDMSGSEGGNTETDEGGMGLKRWRGGREGRTETLGRSRIASSGELKID